MTDIDARAAGGTLGNFGTTSAFLLPSKPSRIKSMDRKAEEATEGRRKSVVILSDRSREIVRLFEELQRKRQLDEEDRFSHSFSQRPGVSWGSRSRGMAGGK
jgi:hypothetical protein